MTIAQENFILEYLASNKSVDACSVNFHEEYFEKFGGTTKITAHGVLYVSKAMRKLQDMYKIGQLSRCVVIYDFKVEKNPSWGYSYWLS